MCLLMLEASRRSTQEVLAVCPLEAVCPPAADPLAACLPAGQVACHLFHLK